MIRKFYPLMLQVLQVFIVLFAAPLFMGLVRVFKCWTQGRTSAGLFQPYRDLLRLFSKDIVLADNASWVFRFTPYMVFGAVLVAGAVVPVISVDLPLSITADIIVLVALFAIARFFTSLAGMDIGTAFGGMGSSREMMIGSLAEPAMLMSVFTVSLVAKSTSVSQIAEVFAAGQFVLRPSLAFALLAFILIAIAETGRIPVDNPSTHLELTMIHEAMILEYSGRHLALMEWANMMKLLLYSSLGIALFFPWGISMRESFASLPVAFILFAAKLSIVAAGIVFVETGFAKMRVFRVPDFLGSAFISATLGMLSFFMLE